MIDLLREIERLLSNLTALMIVAIMFLLVGGLIYVAIRVAQLLAG